ncbi:CRP/FNR family transcriptional regulator [Weissella oryzae SG25]|uniref:CRP/FNR family transcriptional regulator n=1 Tax=Weissella oryzae (strain DSM 25784 / JCM 18191 / LMG 30913 / SG25) TaxID=1329250 RepID=A0A069CRI4_WEIOS|nr:Crp/Fnr family transcriptional regulator [Weissella oryzae]GAK30355.1 CRP/FNR family transcriptional regulator [Weissella oryzae SG25]
MLNHPVSGYHNCLKKVPLFAGLNVEELTLITTIVQQREYLKGNLIMQPEQEANLKILEAGTAKMFSITNTGELQFIRQMRTGDYAGEDSILKSSATADDFYIEALKPCRICYIRQADFKALLEKTPSLALRMLELYAQKMQKAQQHISYLSLTNIEKRVAQYLLDQGLTEFVLTMKLQDLAAYLGTQPETLSRKLKYFADMGWLNRHGKQISLKNRSGMAAYYDLIAYN